jgi:DNA-binding CsgD family transcriptional regulator
MLGHLGLLCVAFHFVGIERSLKAPRRRTVPPTTSYGSREGELLRALAAIRHLTYFLPVARLSSTDYCGILDVLGAATESDSHEPFPQPLLEQLAHLIPCQLVSYGDYDPARGHRGPPFSSFPTDSPGLSPPALQAWAALRHTDPLLPRTAGAAQPLRISDVLTRRQWHEHPLYRAFEPAERVEHMLRVWLVGPGGVVGGFDFDRGTRDFSERDRLVLQTLAPHLLRIRQLVSRVRDRAEGSVPQVLTRREHEVLSLVAGGLTNRQIAARLSVAPGTVRKHLDNVYAKLGVPGRAAAVAVTGVKPFRGEGDRV